MGDVDCSNHFAARYNAWMHIFIQRFLFPHMLNCALEDRFLEVELLGEGHGYIYDS